MECLYFDRTSGSLTLQNSFAPPDVQASDDVLIQVAYSGVCGTDLHVIKGEFPSRERLILGHEFTGRVIKVGDVVKNVKVGDKVGVNPNKSCGKCQFCYDLMPHFCEFGIGVSSVGLQCDGGWAQLCVVPESNVHRLPIDLGYLQGALTEPMSCLLRGWDNLQPVKDDSRILVCGAGVIGVLWCCLLHHRGYKDITVSEPNPARREIVANMNLAAKVLSPDQLSPDCPFPIAIDCSGSPKAMETALDMLGKGGKLLLFGCAPVDAVARVKPFQIYAKELKIIGSLINPCTYQRALKLVCDMTAAGYFTDLGKLGMRTYKLAGYEQALGDLKDGSISKAIFEINALK